MPHANRVLPIAMLLLLSTGLAEISANGAATSTNEHTGNAGADVCLDTSRTQSSDVDDAGALNWHACDADERMSVALGIVLHAQFEQNYDPISIDSELIKYALDRAAESSDELIDLAEARAELRSVERPASASERYAQRLARELHCSDSKNTLMYRQLSGDDDSTDDMDGDATDDTVSDTTDDSDSKPKAHCLPATRQASAQTGSEEQPSTSLPETVTISYHRDVVDARRYKALKATSAIRKLDDGVLESQAFSLDETIKGWQLVVGHMEPEMQYEVVIPPSLAYGPRGVDGRVEANEYLRFIMRLDCVGLSVEHGRACKEGS